MVRRGLLLLMAVLSLTTALSGQTSSPTEVDRGLLLRSANGGSFAAPIVGTAVSVRVTGIVA